MSCDLSVTNQAPQSVEPAQSVELVPVEQSWFALSLLMLIAATFPLWIDQADFPRIPMILGFDLGNWGGPLLFAVVVTLLSCLSSGLWPRRLRAVIEWMEGRWLSDWLMSEQSASGFGSQVTRDEVTRRDECAVLVGNAFRRVLWSCLLVVLVLFVLSDQNRLQPWIWHALLVSAYSCGTGHDRRRWFNGVTLLTVAIYGWSAVSKLDVSFETTYGQQLIEALIGPDRVLSYRLMKPDDRAAVARLLPLGELLTAGFLLVPFTRRWGCVLAIGMHLGLMLAVGPLGLNHRAGVFLWNFYFIGQHLCLWLALGRTERSRGSHWLRSIGERTREWGFARTCRAVARSTGQWLCPRNVPACVLWFALLFPALRTLELCDNWPAWSVYASDIELVTVYVRDDALERLPMGARSCAETSAVKTGWTAIRIERWSLAACRAPIYPQVRYSVAIALALTETAQLAEDEIIVLIRSRPDATTGLRTESRLRGVAELRRFAGRFWLNVVANRKAD